MSRRLILALLLALSGTAEAQDGFVAFRRASLEAEPDWEAHHSLDSTQVWVGPALMILKRDDLVSADIKADRYTGVYGIELVMDSNAAIDFEELTARNVGQNLAIVVDNILLSAPMIRERIPGGRVRIDGIGGFEEAMGVVEIIREAVGVSAYVRPRMSPEEVNLGTPEDAARSYLRAMSLGDWESAAYMLHPSSLEFNAALVDELAFVDDRILFDTMLPGYGAETDGVTPFIPVSLLLNEVPDGPLPESLTREQRVVLLLRIAEIQGRLQVEPNEPTVVGAVVDGETAYVVLRQSNVFESMPFENLGVIHLEQDEAEWRVRSTTLLHPSPF